MKNMFNSSIIMGGSIDFSAPTITKTDCFVCLTATTLPSTNYGQPRYSRIIINSLTK
ncbi:MAG: hypothetical protein K6G25_07870 [Bacteroidales bacterium]|nr:hypothetical protein [Bacteroidales bacterium]